MSRIETLHIHNFKFFDEQNASFPKVRPVRFRMNSKSLLALNSMKKGRFTEHQIVSAFKKQKAG